MIGDGTRFRASLTNGITNYDSKIHVWCGDTAAMNCVGGNDDYHGLQSEIDWDTAPGQEYYILVSGYGGQSGAFELEVKSVGPNRDAPIDCSASATYSGVQIGSNLANVFIQVTPADSFDHGTGLTPFSRSFEPGTRVTVTAPSMWNGRPFAGWEVDGRFVPSRTSVTGIADGSRELNAIYGERGNVQRRR